MSHYGYVSEQLLSRWLSPPRMPRPRSRPSNREPQRLDVQRVRSHFDFPGTGRVVTNNAATSQTPRELIELYRRLSPSYESVHRGQSAASREMSAQFEESFDTIATWVDAEPPLHRHLPQHHRGDQRGDVLAAHGVPRQRQRGHHPDGAQLELRAVARPDPGGAAPPRPSSRVPTRALRPRHRRARPRPSRRARRPPHQARVRDRRVELPRHQASARPVRQIAGDSGYRRLDGTTGSLLLVDAAQLVPTSVIDVAALDVDYLAFSFHKVLAPFGVGVLYGRETLLERSLPFLYGGDMIAEGKVSPERVEYDELPWKYGAGTPNVLGVIASTQALRLLVDLALDPAVPWFGNPLPLPRADVQSAMSLVQQHVRGLTDHALERAQRIPGLQVYGPRPGVPRSPLMLERPRARPPSGRRCLGRPWDRSSRWLPLRDAGSPRAGADPRGSCRLSFAAYTSFEDVDQALDALDRVVREPARSARFR